MKRLAIISSHPIQYNAPLFRLLAANPRLQIKAFYTWEQTRNQAKYDVDFGKEIAWDIPLLEDYEYTFVHNTSKQPGTHHFRGLVNPSLNKEVEQWKPDAILVYGWSFSSHLSCIRYFHKKIPVLFRGDSTLLDERWGMRKLLRRLFLTWVYRHIDYALYVGEHNRDYFLAHGLKPEQLVHAPHAVDNARFQRSDGGYKKEADRWKKELGIKETDMVVLFSGKLENKKDPFFLIELSKRIREENMKFIFVGSGVLEAGLKKAAEKDPRIIFLGFQNQQKMPVVYRLADVFILPSTGPGETWGLAVNEAMACGRAVFMSTMAGGSRDLIRENSNGIVFHPREVPKCSAMLLILLSNRRHIKAMQESSLELIQNFSYQKIVEALEKILFP